MGEQRCFEVFRRIPVRLLDEAARREKPVDMAAAMLEKRSVAPGLRRTVVLQLAAEAGPVFAGALVVLEQDVGGAEEPILVKRA